MQTVDEQIEAVYQIIRESLAPEQRAPFPAFHTLLGRVAGDRAPAPHSLPWLMLPIFVCEALGGDMRRAHHVAAALEMGRLAAGCLDEWQDQDTDGALWQAIGGARTYNLALALTSFSFEPLSRLAALGVDDALILSLHQEFHRTMRQMCAGQDADLGQDLSLESYERVAEAKSGSLFRLGCQAGATVAGAARDVADGYGQFGTNLGVMAQMWNDLEGLAGRRGKRDAEQQRGLPILAAQALGQMALDSAPEGGAVGPAYLLVRFQVYHRRAAEILARCPAPGRLPLFLVLYSMSPLLKRAQ
jgi:hypothetical protein